METIVYVIAFLVMVGGGFYLYSLSQVDAVRAFVQGVVDQRAKHPFPTPDDLKLLIDARLTPVFEPEVRRQLSDGMFDFFTKFGITEVEFPTVDELLAKYPKLNPKVRSARMEEYPEWGRFEIESNLFSKPELRELVDTIIKDVVKAIFQITPNQKELLVLPNSTPNALQPLLATHKGPEALYKFLFLHVDVMRRQRLLLGPDHAFEEMNERISKVVSGVSVPNDLWFEHAFLFAATGSGKTNALSYFINGRLDQVASGRASVVVMESNRDLVMSIARLKRFAPGGDLHGRLILVDFEDVEHSIGMNPWALEDDSGLTPAARESLYVSTIWSLEYLYRSLLKIELSPRQATLLRYATNLLIATPGANLDSLHRLMQPGGMVDFQDHLHKTDEDTQDYFATQFNNKDDRHVTQTKLEIIARIATIKTIPAIRRILNAPKTTLDLDKELAKGRVILINASQQQLSPEGTEIVGRFFLGSLVRAMHRRSLVTRSDRTDTYIFLDECQDFIENDTSIETLLDQARKYRLSLTLASQRPDQLGEGVLSALFGNAAIKMAAHLSDTAASKLARNMDTTSEFIRKPPKYNFAAYVRRVTDTAVYFKAPPFDFAEQTHMTDDEERAIREHMRKEYSASVPQPQQAPPQSDHDNTKAADWPKSSP